MKSQTLSAKTGKKYHVDHIRPLSAGGLHHPHNLQVIEAKANLSKGSTFNGKRRKYSWSEKKEARRKFKQQNQHYQYTKPVGRWTIMSNFIGGVLAGLIFFGPFAFFYSYFYPYMFPKTQQNQRILALRMRKFINLGICVSSIFWSIIILS